MKRVLTISLLSSLVLMSIHVSAEIVKDGKLNLEARNIYWNNDNRNNPTAQSVSEQWGQGFILQGISGYSEGLIGVGVDFQAMWGFRLYAPNGKNSASGLFPYRHNGDISKSFASLGVTGKVRLLESELKVGELQPNLPILVTNDSRLLPQTFEGAAFSSKDIDNLNLNVGYIMRTKARNSTHYQRLKAAGNTIEDTRTFWFAGGDYNITSQIDVAYYFAQLRNFYNQNYVGFKGNFAIGEGTLQPDIRYFNTKNDGEKYAGRIDNNLYSGMLTYSAWGHSLGGGFQKLFGDTGFSYLDPGQSVGGVSTLTGGATTYTIADSQINKFLRAKQRTWLVKYSYDFGAVGLNGLNLSAVYLSGDNVSGLSKNDNEWERNISLGYTVPEGTFKNLGFAWKNAAYRTNVAGQTSQDENRIHVFYKASFF